MTSTRDGASLGDHRPAPINTEWRIPESPDAPTVTATLARTHRDPIAAAAIIAEAGAP